MLRCCGCAGGVDPALAVRAGNSVYHQACLAQRSLGFTHTVNYDAFGTVWPQQIQGVSTCEALTNKSEWRRPNLDLDAAKRLFIEDMGCAHEEELLQVSDVQHNSGWQKEALSDRRDQFVLEADSQSMLPFHLADAIDGPYSKIHNEQETCLELQGRKAGNIYQRSVRNQLTFPSQHLTLQNQRRVADLEDQKIQEGRRRALEEQSRREEYEYQRALQQQKRAAELEAQRIEEDRRRALQEQRRREKEEQHLALLQQRRAAELEAQRMKEDRRRALEEQHRREIEEQHFALLQQRRAAELEIQRIEEDRQRALEEQRRRDREEKQLALQQRRAAELEGKRLEEDRLRILEEQRRREKEEQQFALQQELAAELHAQSVAEARRRASEEHRIRDEENQRRTLQQQRQAVEAEAKRIENSRRIASQDQRRREEEDQRRSLQAKWLEEERRRVLEEQRTREEENQRRLSQQQSGAAEILAQTTKEDRQITWHEQRRMDDNQFRLQELRNSADADVQRSEAHAFSALEQADEQRKVLGLGMSQQADVDRKSESSGIVDCEATEVEPATIELTRGLAVKLLDDIEAGGGKHCPVNSLEQWGFGSGPEAWTRVELALQPHLDRDPALARRWVDVSV